jgi:predicted DCC family thiol-disulfide oxidoreductase YuxK
VEAIVIYDNDCGFCRWSLAVLLSRDARRAGPGGDAWRAGTTPDARRAGPGPDPRRAAPGPDPRRAAPGRGTLRPLPLGTPEADYLLHDLAPAERDASWHLVIDPPGPDQLSFDAAPVRFSAGAAFAPALRLLPRGRRLAWLVARLPSQAERGYGWVAGHRSLLGHFVPGRARRWADRVIAAHGGPARR